MALAGKSVGGPAKVAVMASGFFGSVSGSAIANTVSTGAFTIPLDETGGLQAPCGRGHRAQRQHRRHVHAPHHGRGRLHHGRNDRDPYVDIMLMAIFPAVMYFLSVFVMIHFEAKRYGLVGVRRDDDPTAWQILKKQWYLSSPLVIIVVLMLMGRSPGMAAFWAILCCCVIMLGNNIKKVFSAEGGSGGAKALEVIKTFVMDVLNAMREGAFNTLIIGATVGVIGIIVGTIALTGIGLKFSQIIIELSFGYLPLAIILIGLASLVLGMGVPVTAAYLITAVLAVGAVSDMISQTFWGVSMQQLQEPLGDLLRDDPQRAVIMGKVAWALIASHMIVYWFSQDSNITPPVCVAAYAGAAIAGSDPWKTGWTSFKFAKMLYIGPFLFAFSPGFLLGGPNNIIPWPDVILTMITIVLGTIAFGSLTMGYFLCGTNLAEWIICAVATVLLFFPDILPWATGLPLPMAAEGAAEMKNLLGGKGANIAEMTNLGIPVPAGFTITTEVCTYYYENGESYPPAWKPR
jgi:TRAP transporter 4TM/12TM fusion protein